jgi:cysteinyl-tRNA synthetase
MLKLWNTATRSLENFEPIQSQKVGMYTCGPTVYWDAHIGNMRSYVFEDILQRTLEFEGYDVTRVMNITDVGHLTSDEDEGEDKIEKAAEKEGKTAQEIAAYYTGRFLADASKLNIKIPAPPYLCKATEHLVEQIELIKTLENKGFTYATSDGIYFDTSKFPSYGSFSGQKLEEKEDGARVAVNLEKKNKTDFALWKFSPKGTKRQQEWESPWGIGFPGWHIECSAMSRKYLGQPFDIHCGGIDHIPIHHENEIAQSEAAYGVPLANYWLHNEFLLVDGQKMSKSLGNVYTVTDLVLKGFNPLALRFLFLGTHYRQKQNFTWEAIQSAQNALNKLRATVREWQEPAVGCAEYEADFKEALEDDLNTPVALSVMWELVHSDYPTNAKAESLLVMDRVLGLSLHQDVATPLTIPADIEKLVQQREEVRQQKKWKESDRIRDEIAKLGWLIEDTASGTKVRKR